METTIIFILSSVGIIIIVVILLYFLLKFKFERKLNEILQAEREDAVKRSRATLTGQFSEQISPYFPDFPYSPTEARFIGKPIDFVIFKGADTNEIKEVIFLEIKSGNSQLNKQEKNLKETILKGKVKWDEYKPKLK